MKRTLTTLAIMTSTMTMAQTTKAVTQKKSFSRTTSISTEINADPAIIWKLLTNASDYPRWNSTIISIDGQIAIGNKIKLKSTLAPKKTFKLKVKAAKNEKSMVWGDGQGRREYTLVKEGDGRVKFSMSEKIGGVMFPLYAKYIPSFEQSFEQFAADLKKEAEKIQNIKM